ncbi:MAG: hypothetical protein ACI8WB_003320 [Phenylobacterium sp.]|jgi:uncharacterized protein YjbI with pentapeptide repeats
MQVIKPGKISLISKTYGLNGHQFAVGVLCFFKLGADNALLTENSQWPRITPYLNNGILLDIGYAKSHGEVLVAGKAFAPDHQPVARMTVSLSLGKVKKRLKVIGDRHWNGSFFSPASQAKPFLSLPLTYQQAYGGADYKLNLLGKGVIKAKYLNPDSGYYDLPNIYHQRESTIADSNKRSVAGFGPLDIWSPQRSGFQGTYNKKWLANVHPGFPDDTNHQLFSAAPVDQQIKGFFKPGDRYQLKGMNADLPVIEGQLPDVKARVFISQQQGNKERFKEIKTAIDTVWFFPELALGVAIHRGVIEVNDSDGLDVKKLLLAFDGIAHGQSRNIDYFQQVMALRLDRKTALGHVFNDSQLMPVKTKQQQVELDLLYGEAKELQQQKSDKVTELHIAKLQADNPEIDLKAVVKAQAKAQAGSEKAASNEPGPIPQVLLDSGDFDLTPHLEYANEMAEQAKADMALLLAELEQEKQQYAAMNHQKTESLASMQARVNCVVHVLATDLAAKNPALLPDWMSQVPLTAEQADNAKLMASIGRQARQSSPGVTVLPIPLPPQGPRQMRSWVMELLAAGACLAGRDLAGADLSGMDFSGLDMRDVMLEQADLTGCNFSGCRLDGAVFSAATLHYAQFTGSSMCYVNLSQACGKKTRFNQTDLSHANLCEALFASCDFSDARLDEVLALAVDMRFSTLQRVKCEKGQFVEAKLDHSDWQLANVHSSIFLQPKMQQINWQQATITRCLVIEAQAQGANFCGIRAEKVQFSNLGDFRQVDISAGLWTTCGFRGLDLSDCDGRASVFKGCDFGESQFADGQLNGVLFDGCVMALATFVGADCSEVMFNETALRKCRFENTNLRDSEFNNADMTEVVFKHCQTKGLSQHPQPSLGRR